MTYIPNVWATFLREAYEAALFSPDPSSQNGAVLVTNHGPDIIKRIGYNFIPDRMQNLTERYNDREQKYKWVTHAEEAAVLAFARRSYSSHGAVLYCPWSACTRCARQLCLAGVKTVVRHKDRMDLTVDRWKGEIQEADDLFKLYEVDVFEYCGKLFEDSFTILVDGKPWSP